MQNYTLVWPLEPDKKFRGELLAKVSNERQFKNGYFKEFYVYQTESGKLVGYIKQKTPFVDDYTKCRGCIAETDEELINFFGKGKLALELYAALGIELHQVQ